MKSKLPLLTLCGAITLILFGIALFRPAPPRLLDEYGTIRSPKMNFRVTLSDQNPGVEISSRLSGFDLGFVSFGTTKTVSPAEWTNHEGFFAYIDDEGRCWAYDGQAGCWIYERQPDGSGKSWDIQNWKGAVPNEVLSRISMPLDPVGMAPAESFRSTELPMQLTAEQPRQSPAWEGQGK